MAPPPSTAVPPVVSLIVRVITLVCLLISVVIIVTNNLQLLINGDFHAYRYMLAASVIGIVYTFLQIASTIYFVSTGNRIGGPSLAFVDFFGDKVLSYLLATGAAANFGSAVDMKRSNAAASLLFIGFIFSAVSSILSSFSLPKRN